VDALELERLGRFLYETLCRKRGVPATGVFAWEALPAHARLAYRETAQTLHACVTGGFGPCAPSSPDPADPCPPAHVVKEKT
jgi:hypothetical protein